MPKFSIHLLVFLMFLSDSLSFAHGIQGNTMPCSNSSASYSYAQKGLLNINWNIKGGIINSGQGTKTISITWDYTEHGMVYLTATDSSTSASIIDSLLISVDTSCVWPGDANHDHKVTYTDFLSVAEAFGDTHSVCTDTSTLWTGVSRCHWHDTIGLGINMKHQDCNGDGKIDSSDLGAITRNYGMTGMKKKQDGPALCPLPAIGDPFLQVFSASDTIIPGHTVFASVYLANSVQTANGVYGIAFTLAYDPEVFDGNDIQFDLSRQWITKGTKTPVIFYRNFPTEGHIDFAFSRTDHTFTDGGGELVTLKMHAQNKIPLNKSYSGFLLGEFQYVNNKGSLSAVHRLNDSFGVKGNTGIEQIFISAAEIKIYPNPGNQLIHIRSTSGIHILKLFTADGKQVLIKDYPRNSNDIDLEIPCELNGMYFLEITCSSGAVARSKVFLN